MSKCSAGEGALGAAATVCCSAQAQFHCHNGLLGALNQQEKTLLGGEHRFRWQKKSLLYTENSSRTHC